MINNLPDWVTAGTAVTVVLGGMLGVYTSSATRLDLAEERIANTTSVIEKLADEQLRISKESRYLSERMAVSTVSAEHLKEGQIKMQSSIESLANEVRQLSVHVSKEK